jgi:hypothetical protein
MGCEALARAIMPILLSYTLRNLAARKLTTLLTAGGMALVVFVFATVLMLEEGLRRTLVDTGSPDNVVVTRRSAGTEVQSVIDREQAAIVENQPEVANGIDGARLASKETINPGRGAKKHRASASGRYCRRTHVFPGVNRNHRRKKYRGSIPWRQGWRDITLWPT